MSRVIEPSDRLLDLIYDAASEEELWIPAIIQIADLTSSVGGIVHGVENSKGQVVFAFYGRLTEDAYKTYCERHVTNPIADVMNESPVGKVVRSDDILPLADLKRTALFDEVFKPQDIAHNAMVPLAAKDHFQVGFNLCRSERRGPYDADDLRFLARLYPHMRRALLLGFRLDAYKLLQHAQFGVLDQLSAGVILLDCRAKVVFANTAALAMSAHDGPLRLRNSSLTAGSQAHSQRLGELVDGAVQGVPVASMSIPHSYDGRLFTILVSSVRSRDIDRFAGLGMSDVAAMLVIHDPAQPMEVPVDWIMDAYGLTLAEARVALSTASGATITQTAHRLNVSPNTVKTHLRKVFSKTGSNRQSELARLLASIGLLQANGSRSGRGNGKV